MIDNKIMIPCKWKMIDLLTTTSANDFGEALRRYCFVGNCVDVGCYSSFKLIDGFEKIKSGKIWEEATSIIQPEFTMHVFHYEIKEKDCWMTYDDPEGNPCKSKMGDRLEIVCAWEWDGDGCLYFRYNDRKVINMDCKKDYEWEWVK